MLVLLSIYTSISTKYNASGKHEPQRDQEAYKSTLSDETEIEKQNYNQTKKIRFFSGFSTLILI